MNKSPLLRLGLLSLAAALLVFCGTANAEPPIIKCKPLPPTPHTCGVKPGKSGSSLLIQGNILALDALLVGGDVLIGEDGKISCVACDCTKSSGASDATIVFCSEGVVSPGLINAHDHITYNQSFPLTTTETYDQRNDWRLGKRGHTKLNYKGNTDENVVAWSELRQVMSGTTSVAGSGGVSGFLRNLDRTNLQEGLSPVVDVYNEVFPLGDQKDGTQLETTCQYPRIVPPSEAIDAHTCFLPHIAEGVDQVAHNEFLCMSTTTPPGQMLTTPKSAFIHGVALRPQDVFTLRTTQTSTVWSPRSNIVLYGNTAPVVLYEALGVNVALGTDWMPSGSMNMLRELRCADYMNKRHYNNFFPDFRLWMMTTRNASFALHADQQIGAVRMGYWGDVSIYDGTGASEYYRAVIGANPQGVLLVMRAGKPLYGNSEIMKSLPSASSGCEAIGDVCGSAKSACVQRERGVDFGTLKAANKDSYPLFFCDTPVNEPTCVPKRPPDKWGCGKYPLDPSIKDTDGDGVPDDKDNCPLVFNPVRPVDGFYSSTPTDCVQPDYSPISSFCGRSK